MEPSDGGATGKYVAPSRRAGFQGTASAQQGDQLPSVRVSNLPTDVKEEDLRDLFEQFGKIKKVYLGKDKRTQEFKVRSSLLYSRTSERAFGFLPGFRFCDILRSALCRQSHRGGKWPPILPHDPQCRLGQPIQALEEFFPLSFTPNIIYRNYSTVVMLDGALWIQVCSEYVCNVFRKIYRYLIVRL